jgi:hypothetical protein
MHPTDSSDAPGTADDPEIVAGAAATYFHAAAHLAEASVLARMSSRLIDADDHVAGDEFDRLIRSAAHALEAAAAEHERAADMISRTRWGSRADMADHVDSIRVAVRALNIEAMRFDEWATYDESDGDTDQEADPGDGSSVREQLLDRADTFRDKAWLMAESARVLLDGAHRLAARDP